MLSDIEARLLAIRRRANLLLRARRRLLYWNKVIVISFPKSGRTWLRVILNNLAISPRFSHEGSGKSWERDKLVAAIEARRGEKIVFLHRNPLDTLVSWYFHAVNVKKTFRGSISEFVRHPNFGIEYIIFFNKSWMEAADSFSGFLEVTYEDMRARPEQSIRRMVDFMGVPLVRGSSIRNALEQSSFERMKELERTGKLAQQFPGRFSGPGAGKESSKVREGKIGGFREHLSDADLEYCVEAGERMGWPIRHLIGS